KLAFISGGTVVAGTRNDGTATVTGGTANQSVSLGLVHETLSGTASAPTSATVLAQAVSLYTLSTPNPLAAGKFDVGKTFDVAAVDVLGHFDGTHADFYTFKGQAGDLNNF